MEGVYEICFYGGLVLAILLVITSIALFVIFKIPKVYGELTGRNAKKSIREKKNGSDDSGSVARKEQSKYYNQSTGRIKVRDSASKETAATASTQKKSFEFDEEATEVLSAPLNLGDDETAVLSGGEVADDEATEVLTSGEIVDDEATEVLSSGEIVGDNETNVLRQEDNDDESTTILTKDVTDELGRKVKVMCNVIVTHTDESL